MLDHTHSSPESDKYPNLWGKQILVVEDDVVIAVDYYFQLRQVGATAAAYEPTNEAALNYLRTHEVDAAIVDYRLSDGPCDAVFELLCRRRIPFIAVTGCAHELHGRVGPSQILVKPVTPTEVWCALSEAFIDGPMGRSSAKAR